MPWVRSRPYGLRAIAGPDAVLLRSPIDLRGEDFRTIGEFEVAQGQSFAW